jgi:hypothetical protein
MDPGCIITVKKLDGVKMGMRMSFSLAEFYEAGGVTTFKDRMAASLGVLPG